jgi:gamma-glutamylcyclotransferase (GGCT)/AIG2-like uncharacterized protein YtfP
MRFDKNKKQNTVLVGVYGFLRKGLQNNEHLNDLEDAVPIATYETLPEFTLYDIDGFACLDSKGSSSVVVEIYEISEDTFTSLEWHNNLEGNISCPTNNYELYTIKKIETPFGEVYMFLLDNNIVNGLKKNEIIVESGNWFDYVQTKIINNRLLLEC